MVNLRQTALDYVPGYKNITELKKVSIDVDIEEKEFTDKEGKQYTALIITVDEEEYRVPKSVLAQLKAFLEDDPEMEFFKVKSSGSGLNTTYTVMPAK